MADRSFEEQVREEMSGLLIRPGAAVWEQLEADLTRKKKRRGLIWFVFAGTGILLLSAVWISQRGIHEKAEATLAGIVLKKNTVAPQKELDAAQPDSSKQVHIHDKTKLGQPVTIAQSSPVTASLISAMLHTKTGKKPIPVTVNGIETHTDGTVTNNPVDVVDVPLGNTDGLTTAATLLTPDHKEGRMDSVTLPAAKAELISDTLRNTTALPTTEKATAKKRWQLSLAVTVGTSGMRKLPGQTLVYQSSISNPSAGGLPGGNNPYKLPSLQDAGSYGITLLVDKQLSKRYGMGFSAGYESYRSKTGVGKKVDSSLQTSFFTSAADQGFYYVSTDSVAYVNRFHFAQASVSGYALYALGKSLQLRWELGLGLSALLGSNALHYDNGRGVLFTNRSLLRTLQWNLSTDFEFGLGKQPFIFLGPQITWFLQSPYTDQGSADQHLFRSALRARMVLGKKRK